MKITIDVTQDDIDQGCRKDASGQRGGCMVHRAFMRATEGAYPYAWIGNFAVGFGEDDASMNLAYFDDDGVRRKINDFDLGRHVDPFSFELDIPIEVVT